jgi:hypothetical protein
MKAPLITIFQKSVIAFVAAVLFDMGTMCQRDQIFRQPSYSKQNEQLEFSYESFANRYLPKVPQISAFFCRIFLRGQS